MDRQTYRIDEADDSSNDEEGENFPVGIGGLSNEPATSAASFSALAKQIQSGNNSDNKNNDGGGRDRSGGSKKYTSDAADKALSMSGGAAAPSVASASPSQPQQTSTPTVMFSSDSDFSRSGNRRQYLKTVHSGRSLHSDMSSNQDQPDLAVTAATAAAATTTAVGVRGSDRRSQWNRSPNAVRGGSENDVSADATEGSSPNQNTTQANNTVEGQAAPSTGMASAGGAAAATSPPPPGLDRMQTAGGSPIKNNKRANLLASRLKSRSNAVKSRLNSNDRAPIGGAGGGSGGGYYGGGDPVSSPEFAGAAGQGGGERPNVTRRYKPGDHVLVCNQQSRWSTLVNRYGFPPGEGATPEEMRGPYIYAMATVKQVHFEEFAAYYTVTRADTGAEQRADADFMEPIRTLRGEQAAFRAAMQSSLDNNPQSSDGPGGVVSSDVPTDVTPRHKALQCLEDSFFIILLPFLWIYDYLVCCINACLAPVGRFLTRQAKLILMGMEPYACKLRLTVVNFIVVCAFWYMFIDQARLAFFAPRSDHAIAIINFLVWLILLAELLFEVFIRPDGYQNLIISEKAFAPQTVRYINAFHLVVESVSLALFIPEFYCIFSKKDSCSDRLSFSFYNAALMAVTGPTRVEAVYGRAYFALIRLRVFGLVRHWKNMWITNTFLMGRKRSAERGFLSNIFPQRARSMRSSKKQQVVPLKRSDSNVSSDANAEGKGAANNTNPSATTDAPKDGGDLDGEGNPKLDDDNKDATLTNASNIGTALMVTNSYRAISLLWVITGVFPIFAYSLDTFLINSVSSEMTKQLQATNLIANDTSDDTCSYLYDSVYSWIQAVVAPDVGDDPDDPYLITLDLKPERCNVSSNMCETMAEQSDYSQSLCDQRAGLSNASKQEQANALGVRVGSIVEYYDASDGTIFWDENGTESNTTYSTFSSFDQSYSIATAAFGSLLLQLSLLILVLGGLSVLRRDAEVLVLGPLRRMLKIVARYAKNPLVQPKLSRMRGSRRKLSQRVVSRDDDSFSDTSSDDSDSGDNAWRNDQFALGSYETEQLIAAVTKITDLLRKCWGVAGADIISTNLATREGALTEIFNPTVPGKSVYALFAFAAINDFDHALRNLGGDVMILINDVAAVLHGEVFRWGFGDSGQCNKNLGGAFLMVFRIGLVKEVIKKLEQATDVIFSGSKASQSRATQALTRRRNKLQQQQQPSLSAMLASPTQLRRNSSNTIQSLGSSSSAAAGGSTGTGSSANNSGRPSSREGFTAARTGNQSYRRLLKVQRSASVKAMSLSLASLPGISTFTDRAVIGMLKSFASIHRDHKLRSWNNDFRLGAGVGAFTVSMIYGMDAGWAVEGAVGSAYKIDATYLSPHVNMASRMMSACKQYGVSILLSQAVQELMSDVAVSKLRHLDTVTVKGSSVKQKIFTYDARHQGADFFLYSRTDDQADVEADQYTPNIWSKDADLNAMRQHVTEEFLTEFSEGRKMFLLGEWDVAKRRLEKANELMVENAIEGGYLEAELEEIMNQAANPTEAAEELKRQNGDGPSQYLLNFMHSLGGVPPSDWEGWHPLTRK